MKCIKVIGCGLLALLFVSAVPYAAEAGSVKIYPNQFKPVTPSDLHNYQTPSELKGNGGAASYSALVQLPVGKTVTRFVVFHSSDSGGSYSYGYLYRSQFGAADPYQTAMADVTPTGDTDDEAIAFNQTIIAHAKVKSGFRYWVLLNLGTNNRVHGVKVVYE